jgi:hypothetical protein
MTAQEIQQSAIRTVQLEAESIAGLEAYINDDFIQAVQKISSGRDGWW